MPTARSWAPPGAEPRAGGSGPSGTGQAWEKGREVISLFFYGCKVFININIYIRLVNINEASKPW